MIDASVHNILLVEDNEDDVFALKWALRKAQISLPLQVVTDGRQAKGYLAGDGQYADRQAFPLPNLVFLDLKLPYLNGFEVLEWVRGQASLKDLQVVILTGSDESRDHERAVSLGADLYLVKPAEPEALTNLFARLGRSSVTADV